MATAAAPTEDGELLSLWDTKPHPWRRYGARSIDIALFSTVSAVIAASFGMLFWPPLAAFFLTQSLWLSFLVLTPISIVLTGIGVAVCHAFWGVTVGKWIFRLKVRAGAGERLSFGQALQREAILAVWGFGFGLPFISLLTLALSHSELENDGATRWDRKVGAQSSARTISGFGYAWLVIGTILVIAAKSAGMIGIFAH